MFLLNYNFVWEHITKYYFTPKIGWFLFFKNLQKANFKKIINHLKIIFYYYYLSIILYIIFLFKVLLTES